MLAEIHRKTPFTYFEDLLTADVFMAFKYLPPYLGIIPFLRTVPTLEVDVLGVYMLLPE
ncbi:MAG TPA: hypothetical protein VLL52_04395 [Anaerolineae bacterium]|nr:hypothetical protein [Anaerolineae bacterium]